MEENRFLSFFLCTCILYFYFNFFVLFTAVIIGTEEK